MKKQLKFPEKYFIAAAIVFTCHYMTAQSGNVGINTTSPTSTLHVKSKGNTSSTQSFRLENSDGTNLFTVNDDGTVSGSSVSNLGGSGSATNGKNALVKTTAETAGSNCAGGGIKVESGLDNNSNGTLDASEITATRYVCNGNNGQGFSNGTAGGQVYLTGSASPYAPQNPQTVTGDVTLTGNAISSIANNAVTTNKINDLAVTTGKLANASVTTAKISATGTASATTYLRGDGSWSAPTSTATTLNVELFSKVSTSQTINDLENASPPTFTTLNFSSSNDANASLTGGNTWNGNTFTVGTSGAGWYQVAVQMVAAGISGSNTNAANNILVHMFLDKNNIFGNTPGNNTAPAYINSTTNNTVFPYTWSNFITAGSSNFWLKGLAQINTIIYLNAGDFINFKACSESNNAPARTSTDGSSNITIIKIK